MIVVKFRRGIEAMTRRFTTMSAAKSYTDRALADHWIMVGSTTEADENFYRMFVAAKALTVQS